MSSLFTQVQDYLLDIVNDQAKRLFRPIAEYLRRLGIGLAILIVSAIAWSASLVFLLLTLFFALSEYHNLVLPAFWTAAASICVGIVFLLVGLTLVRKPR